MDFFKFQSISTANSRDFPFLGFQPFFEIFQIFSLFPWLITIPNCNKFLEHEINNLMEQIQKQFSPIVCAARASTHLQNFTEVFELIQKEKIYPESRPSLQSNLVRSFRLSTDV